MLVKPLLEGPRHVLQGLPLVPHLPAVLPGSGTQWEEEALVSRTVWAQLAGIPHTGKHFSSCQTPARHPRSLSPAAHRSRTPRGWGGGATQFLSGDIRLSASLFKMVWLLQGAHVAVKDLMFILKRGKS